jgi:hypothetical protein
MCDNGTTTTIMETAPRMITRKRSRESCQVPDGKASASKSGNTVSEESSSSRATPSRPPAITPDHGNCLQGQASSTPTPPPKRQRRHPSLGPVVTPDAMRRGKVPLQSEYSRRQLRLEQRKLNLIMRTTSAGFDMEKPESDRKCGSVLRCRPCMLYVIVLYLCSHLTANPFVQFFVCLCFSLTGISDGMMRCDVSAAYTTM